MKIDPIHDIMLEKLKNKINNLDTESKTYYKKQINETKKLFFDSEGSEFSFYAHFMIFGTSILFLAGGFVGKILSIITFLGPIFWIIKRARESEKSFEKTYKLLDFNFIENYKESIIKYSENSFCDNKIIKENIAELEMLSKSKKELKYKLQTYFSLEDMDIKVDDINEKRIINIEKIDVVNEISKIKFDVNNHV